VSGTFRALVLDQVDGKVQAKIEDLDEARLPEGDVLVDVEYSTLNYKDAMILKGIGRLVRSYPHVPGIDFAGKVVRSASPQYHEGDSVILTGWRVGEVHWGGYAGRARVKSEWLVPKPADLDLRQAMAIGTAGFTAMLAVEELAHQHVTAEKGPVVVTGATGGVGSIAVALLATRGYEVHAVTGKSDQCGEYLRRLGAKVVIDRKELEEAEERPLLGERWAGAVDAVGGKILASILAQMMHGGCVSACGLAASPALKTTVIPFLLRGVRLVGIDSVLAPFERRQAAWQRLAVELPKDLLEQMIEDIKLEDLPAKADEILAGRVKGRLVVGLPG
jgi:acrylyl-CoA reductase (NADPH)